MALAPEYKKRIVTAAMRMEQDGLPPETIQAQVDRFKATYDDDLHAEKEFDFREWYADKAIQQGLSQNPDDPQHFYNYRAAFRAGAEPDETGHWPSRFKREGHPDLIVNGIDTRTDQPPDWDIFQNPAPYFEKFQPTALVPQRSANVAKPTTDVLEVPSETVRQHTMQLTDAGKQPEIMEPVQVVPGDMQKPFTGDIKEAAKAFARNIITGPRAMQEMQNQESFKKIVDKQRELDELVARTKDVGSTPEDEKKILRLDTEIERRSKQLQGNAKMVDWLKSIEGSALLKPKEVERLEGPAGFLQDVTQGLTQLGGQFLARAVNPSLGAAAIASQITGNTVATLEEYGVDKKEAVPLAILNAAVQYPLEKLAMGNIAKNVLRNGAPVVRKLVSSFVSEGGTEGIQQIPDEVLGQMWGETKGETIEQKVEYLRQNLPELAKRAGYAGLVGGVIGTTATGIGRAGARVAGVKEAENPSPTPATQPPGDAPVAPPPAPAEQTPPASLTEQQEKTISARMRRAEEMTAKAADILGEQVKTQDDLFSVARGLKLKLGVKTFADVQAMDDKVLGEKLNTLNDKEQRFLEEMPLDELDAYSVPAAPAPAKTIRKTPEGTTITAVPGEQASIVPPPTTEVSDAQQEKGQQGRLQVTPPPVKPAPVGEPTKRTPTKEEFTALSPEQKDVEYARLKEESETDQLTGTLNRTGAADRGYLRMVTTEKDGKTTQEPEWLERPDGTSDMVVLDIDNFKKGVNDAYGHRVGDQVLSNLGATLRAKLQGLAEVVRWGGEELSIIPLQNADRNVILSKVEEARQEFAGEVFPSESGELSKVTFSAGYGKNFDAADESVYNAKKAGKARTFTEEGQYAENDLQPTAIREPGRRATDKERAGREGAQEVSEPAQEVKEKKGDAPVAPTVAPTPVPKPPVSPSVAALEKTVVPATDAEAATQFQAAFKKVSEEQKAALAKAEKEAKKKLPRSARGKVTVKLSKDPPGQAQKLMGKDEQWEAAVWFNPQGNVVEVHINENLPVDKYAEALYHEIPGHIGQRLVFADNPNILNTMRQMYGAAKTRKDADLQAIRKAYKADIEKAGERGDEVLFEEWTAHHLHRYLMNNDRASLPTRVYNLLRAALVKIGIAKPKIDDVLRSMVTKMSRAKDIGVLEGEMKTSFMRSPEGGRRIYDLESAKALAEEYGVDYSGSEPAPGGPNYLFTDKKTGTQFKANSRNDLAKALADLGDRVAPKGTVKAGPQVRFKRPTEEGEGRPDGIGPTEDATKKPARTIVPTLERSVSPGEVNLDIEDETKADMMRRFAFDRYTRLRRLMEAAERETGKPLPDELQVYQQQDIINSKIDSKAKRFRKDFIDPIVDITIKNNLTIDQVDDYLYALHAKEANELVGKRRPDMVKAGIAPSGMTNEQADQILSHVKESGKESVFKEISATVQKWNRARLDMMVQDGLMTEEQRDQFLEEYKNYVPLKGIGGGKGKKKKELPRIGKGYNVSRKEFFMRKGRTTKAQNILAHLAEDTVEKAIRGEKNRVIQSLYKFSKEFKNDMVITEPAAVTKVYDEETGEFKDRLKTQFSDDDIQTYGAPLNFKIDGKPMQLLIRDVPLMRAMRNMGADASDAFTQVLVKGVLPAQRYLAMVRTQLSINFIPSNALRDTMTAQLNALGLNLPKEQQKGLALDILKGVPKAMKWAYQGQTSKDSDGAKDYKEFVAEGGAIEFFGLKDVEGIQKELQAQINSMKPGAIAQGKRLMRSAYEYITILNGSVENANRLSTYVQLRKRGVSKQQAAYIAKNITVNFNRKGEAGTFLNAWALFANASLQGSVRIIKTLKESKTVRKIVGGIVLSSLGYAELMRMMVGDDPEDKENYYDKISDFVRDTHLVLPFGLKEEEQRWYHRIPLPYGYNVFWAFGQHMSRVIHGEASQIPVEAVRMVGVIADAFNPIGGAVDLTDPKSVIRNFTPTLAQPIAEIALNRNFMDAPVYKEQLKGYGPAPVAAHSKLKSTPKMLADMTGWANDITGGGKYRAGVVNLSPDVINHLFEFGTGGVGKLGVDLINAPFEWVSNKQVPWRSIPLAQRFYGEVNEYKDVKVLYDNMEKAQRIYNDYKEYKTTDPEKAIALLKKYPVVISLMKPRQTETMDKNFNTRRKTRVMLNASVVKPLKQYNELRKKYDEAGDKKAVERIEKNIVNHAQTWNAKLEKALKAR